MLHAAPAALGHGVERPDRFQLVAEQLQAQRLVGAGRPDVDDAAAGSELPYPAHLDRRFVAAAHQRGEQRALLDPLSHAQLDLACGQLRH